METTILYRISSISEPKYELKAKPADYTVPANECEVTMTLAIKVMKDNEEIVLVISVDYFEKKNKDHLLSFELETAFKVNEFEKTFDSPSPDIIKIPDGFLLEAIQLSIGVARGMLALKNKGTYLDKVFLPIYNVADLVANLKASKTTKNA